MAKGKMGKVLQFIPQAGIRSLIRAGIDMEDLEWRISFGVPGMVKREPEKKTSEKDTAEDD